MVDTSNQVSNMVNAMGRLRNYPPSLYIDLEGINLSREGSISILQIYVEPLRHTYLVDIYTLRYAAFDTRGAGGSTLRSILESKVILKVFFDVRNDSDALYAHYGIYLHRIYDLQLMVLASRVGRGRRAFCNGLGKCMEHDAGMTSLEVSNWKAVKDGGARLFAPERGGRYEVFNERPLPETLVKYCTQDVKWLPVLWATYNRRLDPWWKNVAGIEAGLRVEESHAADYKPHGRQKAEPPRGWE